jgi:hypothetical protein
VKGRWLWVVIAANLLVLVGLVFVFPHLMVSPGPLLPAHAGLATDCFACHAPWRGASVERCVACHAPADIGLRSSRGVAIQAVPAAGATRLKPLFHQALTEANCMACHSDHAGPQPAQGSRKPFVHALLRAGTRSDCQACHAAPDNSLHRNLGVGCAQCHQATAWKPATFEHGRYFVLDGHHNAPCSTCHTTEDRSRYTCYGCHEHTPARIRSQHVEEGIPNFEHCVQCHRSAAGEHEGRGSREGGAGRQGGERD